ncbi:RagB/SusD family nutrient uptake outer membrane protein [Rhizosphaericola mali]|uniref:RagB/SusD family nutrient uptake outer membrane protein n=1 Tax=Rhizosphaericola mali TaxID=2545455 RepID=A0A5P2G7Y8_9BACT|nr:RagB/SusD family nutrient uptake outer membrane protein [Rhizosphaericola mali]QES90399.1 RagB/SusD family nutrient uptake outer membrane protein [Rhizosphaericola mali]
MKIVNKLYIAILGSLVGFASCKKDLNLTQLNSVTADNIYTSAAAYKEGLVKVYASYAVTSSQGPASSDLGGIDAGTSDFLRLYWMAQELPTDEAICSWQDVGIPDLNYSTWTSSNTFLLGLYTRSIYQITIANEFLKESTDDKLSARNISSDSLGLIKQYRAEARFIRAYQYWVLMDMFGNPPFVTEYSTIGTTNPPQIKRADLFKYVETELLDIEDSLVTARDNEYGRADQGADWALLSRLYLNAGVYTGTTKYDSAILYSSKVIDAGYSLNTTYANLFKGDNNLNNNEEILTINYDGVNTQNYGGTTYIINAEVSSAMGPTKFGIPTGGWGGNRSRSPLPNSFTDNTGATDTRAMFYITSSSTTTITDPSTFTQGYALTKWTNLTSTGATPASIGGTYCSTDFPLFRLAEVYLNYAEAVLRGGAGGSTSQALAYVNLLRQRAYGSTSGNFGSITLTDLLSEKMREMYWEATRRTDLIRYGMFTGSSYVWPWKGGNASGIGTSSYRDIYPLPLNDVTTNTNLTQNTGY